MAHNVTELHWAKGAQSFDALRLSPMTKVCKGPTTTLITGRLAGQIRFSQPHAININLSILDFDDFAGQGNHTFDPQLVLLRWHLHHNDVTTPHGTCR